MICLLLIMTIIFINSIESTEQKVRHSETLLKEEDMNAKTKAWLLMVESGKVDQEELRRITPKSIFIAPLLSSRAGKCKEGYRHDHLGQCVKVIKIDPQVQLELLLQKLNKLYGDKQNEKEGEKEDLFEVSSGPLHFSLPISNADGNANRTSGDVKSEAQQVSSTTPNTTSPAEEEQNVPEFIPIPLPMVYQNQTNQTKETESSGEGAVNEGEAYETFEIEGSGDGQSASGDGLQEEESTTPSQVRLLSEETDYYDATETRSTTLSEMQYTTEVPDEDSTTTEPAVEEVLLKKSYQNINSTVNKEKNGTAVPLKDNINEETTVKNYSNSERIYFPSDEHDGSGWGSWGGGSVGTPLKPQVSSSRIRFPDEVPQQQAPGHISLPDSGTTSNKYQVHSSTVPREQFWWLPKNWQIDENRHRSALVKVWSRLPLIHDITFTREPGEGYMKSPPPQIFDPQYKDEAFPPGANQQQPQSGIVKPFKSSRFQDILISPRQNFRFQR